jgi:hypothetical protein
MKTPHHYLLFVITFIYDRILMISLYFKHLFLISYNIYYISKRIFITYSNFILHILYIKS